MKRLTTLTAIISSLLLALPVAAQDAAEAAKTYPAEGLSIGMLLIGLGAVALVGGVLIMRERSGDLN